MEWDKKKLIKAIVIPVAVGGVSGFLSSEGMKEYAKLNQPPLSPPGWLFPIVWTVLYVLMGIASYLVLYAETEDNKFQALSIYALQLLVNFFWPIFFFAFRLRFFALLWLIILWFLVFWLIRKFYRIIPKAAYLIVPYLLWLTFAAYLNLGSWWMNR